MSGREAGRDTPHNPDALEVVPGARRDELEGWIPQLASEEELRQALEQAFGYRGDVLITRKDGSKVEGYVFADIASLAFTGRDMAAGKSWEHWVRQYWERRAAGEKNISLEPEKLE